MANKENKPKEIGRIASLNFKVKRSEEEKSLPAIKSAFKNKEKSVLKTKAFWKQIAVGLIFAFFVGCFGVFSLLVEWMIEAPDLDTGRFHYLSTTKILDNQGNLYQEFQGQEKRESVSIEEIPEIVQYAFISIEDQRFYKHEGVDFRGTLKAVLSTFVSGLEGSGGSTITQQLIKQTHLTSQKALKRKVQEWYLSYKLEKTYTKEEILEAYLNKINLSQAWGVQAASRYYFNKDVSEISIAQAAVLASIVKTPTYYNPLVYSEDENGNTFLVSTTDEEGKVTLSYNENNKERALLVVMKMYELGHISKKEYEIAKDELNNNKIGLIQSDSAEPNYTYFTDSLYTQVVQDLMTAYRYSEEDASNYLLNSGLTIKATVDPAFQQALDETATNNYLFPSQSYSAARASQAMSEYTGKPISYIPQVGMAVVENKTGAVVALLGGRGEKTTNLSINRALQQFQPGSSTKPLTVYGPALSEGIVSLDTVIVDQPINIGGWTPQNAGGGFRGAVTVREGIRSSINTVAVQVFMKLGVTSSAAYGKKFGMDLVTDGTYNDLNPAALALGGQTHGQSPLIMASAYTTFPNGGVRCYPHLYTEIVDDSGNVVLEAEQGSVEVIRASGAEQMVSALRGVVQGGTTNVSIAGDYVGGKTGTTDENRHAWFCGFTSRYAAAVWYGYDQNIVVVNGARYVLNIGVYGGNSGYGPSAFWQAAMRKAYSYKGLN